MISEDRMNEVARHLAENVLGWTDHAEKYRAYWRENDPDLFELGPPRYPVAEWCPAFYIDQAFETLDAWIRGGGDEWIRGATICAAHRVTVRECPKPGTEGRQGEWTVPLPEGDGDLGERVAHAIAEAVARATGWIEDEAVQEDES